MNARKLLTLEDRTQRLQTRLARLQALDRRFSWYRLTALVSGAVLGGLALVYLPSPYNRLTALACAAAFFLVVALHRRLDGWRARLLIWQELRRSQLARLKLDWSEIPLPCESDKSAARSSLETDLDLTGPYSLQHLLDFCASTEGSRLLADWLSQPAPEPDQILVRQALVRELAGFARFRDRLLLNLRLVSRQPLHGARLLRWLGTDLPEANLPRLVLVASVLITANLALLLLSSLGLLPGWWPITSGLIILFYFYRTPSLQPFLESVVELDQELDKLRALVRHIEKTDFSRRPSLQRLCAPFQEPARKPSTYLRRVKLVTAAVGLRMNPIIGLVINLLFPWDFTFAWLAANLRTQARRVLPAWLETWYRLDALCSLANFADLHPEYVYPHITLQAQPAFTARSLGHPLIPVINRVTNDFTIPEVGHVALITGSNMAGKSTFIRTVGINLCLAYAGAPVCAGELRALPFGLHTCIRISDSIADGFSYFYAEVKCLRRLLDHLEAESGRPLLYLIDEIYRGTNNRERLQGSRALLGVLSGRPGVGLIATHDLELASLADTDPLISNYHFRDRVENGRLTFDYQLRPGPCPTTNALEIMRREGLPVA